MVIIDILKRREENENGEIICIREINENIDRVFANKPLTRPLSVLNKNCQFRKRYDIAFDLRNEEKIKKEVKQRMKEYSQKPEVKQRMKEYKKEYSQKPEVKQRMKEYRQKPEVKQRKKKWNKEYYQKIKKLKNNK